MNAAHSHNLRRGNGLAVLVMDHLRQMADRRETVTLWSLNRALCERFELHGRDRDAQYSAVRTVVGNLEAAGLIGSRKEWDKDNERYLKHIWPCSAI